MSSVPVPSIGRAKASWFTRFASKTAHLAGHPVTFGVALGIIIFWAMSGPIFGFNDTWQLVINTSTTIVTFLMVFLIQNTQNRDSNAIHVKLDELIRAQEGANKALLDIEELDETDLETMRHEFERLAEQARNKLAARKSSR